MSVSNPFVDARRALSEAASFRAEQAWSTGDVEAARKLFAEAALLEEAVALEVPAGSSRVRSVLAISAVALWYKAADFERAKRTAYVFLGGDGLTPQGRGDLEKLVDRCSREVEVERMARDSGMIPLEVKLDGGRVGFGFAPAAVARKRRDEVMKLLMRTADMEADLDFRVRGESDLEGEQIQIFEVPAIAASYGLRFYVASGTQQLIDTERLVTPQRIVERFLAIATAAIEGPDAVRAAVVDEQYAHAFVAGFGEIAPDGSDVASVTCSTPTWKLASAPTTVFEPRHRTALRGSVAPTAAPREQRAGERTVEGTLATVHFGRDNYIEIAVVGRAEPELIMVDDSAVHRRALGFMNTEVRAFGKWSAKRQRLILNAIIPVRR